MPSCAHAHWSQLGQGKYLDNASSCGESKAPVYFSSLLLIVLLITPCVLEAQRWLSCSNAVYWHQSFYCWLWPVQQVKVNHADQLNFLALG